MYGTVCSLFLGWCRSLGKHPNLCVSKRKALAWLCDLLPTYRPLMVGVPWKLLCGGVDGCVLEDCFKTGGNMMKRISGQTIGTSAEDTSNGGLVRKDSPNYA